MTPKEFRDELMRLGLIPTGEGTELIEEWLLDGNAVYLPRPEVIPEHDRREGLYVIKKQLGIGRRNVH